MTEAIDRYFMNIALELAEKGKGYTSPNPMVGAVVVKNGVIVGQGYHEVVGGPHAEVNAINDAGQSVENASMYVTLEPCNHTGRTPPCTQKILASGIKKVIVAMKDPNPGVAGGGIEMLREHGVEVTTGVEEIKAKRLNEAYIKYVTTHRPFVVCKCASTLDGRIATRTGDSKWVTGAQSRKFVHMLRHSLDGIMVGIETVKIDDPSLTARLENCKGKDLVRIILDTYLSIPETARVLQIESEANTIIITGDSISSSKKSRLVEKGAQVLESPLKNGRIDLEALMHILGKMEITSLLIEGGSRVLASAISSGIVDKIFFFYAPKILGGDDGVPICQGTGVSLMRQAVLVKDISIHRFDDDILVEGYL